MEDKDYKLECLSRSIKEVEMAKMHEPELYKKALASLKKEAKAISSIEDLKRVRDSEDEAEEEMEDEDDDA